MDFGVETGIFLAYTAGLLIIYLFGKMFIAPLKLLLKLVVSSIIGGLVLVFIKALGGVWGIIMPVNVITALLAGALGLPGVVAMLIYFNIFH